MQEVNWNYDIVIYPHSKSGIKENMNCLYDFLASHRL